MNLENERPSSPIPGLHGHITGLHAPLSELPWSDDFVMQAIELLPVALDNGRLMCLRPLHGDSFIVGWPAKAKPEEVALKAIEQLGLEPIVLHSTSWRQAGEEVVLTYLAVVSVPAAAPPSWEIAPVMRAELARGDATAPPSAIGVIQVQEHALRHLTWLLRDDAVIANALPDWAPLLADYVPEPFRAFGEPGSNSSNTPP